MSTETTPTFDTSADSATRPWLCDFTEAPGPALRAWTWAAAMREIESILSWVLMNDDAYVIFSVGSRWNRFVQARATNDGRLFVEATDDTFTEPEPYELADLVELIRLGWRPEEACDDTPNWWREADPRWFYAQPMMAELMVRTLIDVHKATGPADILVKHGSF